MSIFGAFRTNPSALRTAGEGMAADKRPHVKRVDIEHLLDKSASEWKDYYDKAADKRQGEWKKTYDAYRRAAQNPRSSYNIAKDDEPAADEQAVLPDQADSDILSAWLSEEDDILNKAIQDAAEEFESKRKEHTSAVPSDEAEKTGGSSSKIEDKSGELTRRLVAATHRMEIGDIVAEAFKSILELRMALGSGDGENSKEIKACIRKLEKVVSRCFKKNKELGKEDAMRLEQARAERNEEKQRAKEIKEELRQHIKKRKARERKYLYEKDEEGEGDNSVNLSGPSTKLDAATEAQIEMQANAIAAAETSGGGNSGGASFGGGDSGASLSGGGTQSGGAAQVSGGGEAAAGAEVSLE